MQLRKNCVIMRTENKNDTARRSSMNDPFGYQAPHNEDWLMPDPRINASGGFATAAMILGICSAAVTCCCCCLMPLTAVAGILAIVFAFIAKNQNEGILPRRAMIGLILGIVGLALCVLVCWFVFTSTAAMPPFPDEGATQAEIDQWIREYKEFFRAAGIDVDLDAFLGE